MPMQPLAKLCALILSGALTAHEAAPAAPAVAPAPIASIELVTGLVSKLQAESFEQSAEATLLLVKLGQQAAPLLRQLRAGQDPQTQARLDDILQIIYQRALYELGAIPLTPQVRSRLIGLGIRHAIVDGWVRPGYTPLLLHADESLQKLYGGARRKMGFDEYCSLLDLEAYNQVPDPTLLLLMRFALENLHSEQVPCGTRQPFLDIYEARIGLEPEALCLLRGRLSTAELMKLIQKHYDLRLLALLPAPQPDDRAYLEFLAGEIDNRCWGLLERVRLHCLLFKADPAQRLQAYKQFLLSNLNTPDWRTRRALLSNLLLLPDAEATQALEKALLSDPVTECRLEILENLPESPHAQALSAPLHKLAAGGTAAHRSAERNGEPTEWDRALRTCLETPECKLPTPPSKRELALECSY